MLAGLIFFPESTRDTRLRQPVFLGLRQDKIASGIAYWSEARLASDLS
jgi:hypothetical protein